MTDSEKARMAASAFPRARRAGFTLSNPTTSTGTDGTISASGYSLSITNSSIASTPNACHVDVGTSAATPADDGLIKCP
jgi:hypothetical protein